MKVLVGKSPAMEAQSEVTVGGGTLNVTEPVGWYKEDILWSILHPELCLASS